MNKFKNPVIFIALLVGFALIGSLINSRTSLIRAAGGPTVTIDPAQLPLHVTGSTTVSGTVGISGNTAATPLFVHEVGTTSLLYQPEITSTSTDALNHTVTLDTSAAKTIRLNAEINSCGPCSPVRVSVLSSFALVDQFTINNGSFPDPGISISRVYEVPGPSLTLA